PLIERTRDGARDLARPLRIEEPVVIRNRLFGIEQAELGREDEHARVLGPQAIAPHATEHPVHRAVVALDRGKLARIATFSRGAVEKQEPHGRSAALALEDRMPAQIYGHV